MQSETDRIDVKSVIDFLGIGKTLFYGRYLPDCQIKPTKAGAFSYITQSEFDLLKDYHLAKGESKEALAEFLQELGKLNGHSQMEIEGVGFNTQSWQINALIKIIEKLLKPDTSLDAVAYQEMAAKLSARLTLLTHYSEYPDARLSTKELAMILEISPRTLHSKKEYQRVGFCFVSDRAGWQVLSRSKE